MFPFFFGSFLSNSFCVCVFFTIGAVNWFACSIYFLSDFFRFFSALLFQFQSYFRRLQSLWVRLMSNNKFKSLMTQDSSKKEEQKTQRFRFELSCLVISFASVVSFRELYFCKYFWYGFECTNRIRYLRFLRCQRNNHDFPTRAKKYSFLFRSLRFSALPALRENNRHFSILF